MFTRIYREPAAQEVVAGENFEEIAQQAYAELEAEEKGLPTPIKKKDDESAHPDDQKAEESANPSKEEEGQEAAPVEKTDEEKASEEKAAQELKERATKAGLPETATQAEVEAKEKEQAENAEPTDEQIQAYAVKHSMTYAEAKSDILANRAEIKNFKNDPEELARALRHNRRGYDQLRAQLEKKPKEQLFVRMTDEQFTAQAKTHLMQEKDKHVEAFRQRFPAKADLMTDEAIIEELVDRSLLGYKNFAEKKETELKEKASSKRESVLAELSESDKKFIPDVKAILNKTSDYQILSEGFDVMDIVHWAKGQRYDADIKAAEERGYKRGLENPKILGAKGPGGGSAPIKSKGTALSEAQKARAVEMFPDVTAEEAQKLFKETYDAELKENPAFVY